MIARMAARMLRETDLRLLAKFAVNVGWKGARALSLHRKRLAKAEFFPPFVFISVTDACNLSCQGCWVTSSSPGRQLSRSEMADVISDARANGSHFFGLLGGEPLLHEGLFDIMADHGDCYFQVFTNGALLTDDVAREMRRLGNVTPLVSVEGLGETSSERRGAEGVYERALAALEACRRNRLITGVATSVCKSNLDEVVSEDFTRDMASRGAHYLWYYIYRPVGPRPCPELALDEDDIVRLRRFLVDHRPNAPLMLVDAYWDHEGRAVCPAAAGISHHVGPGGDVEPCPPIQFSTGSIRGNGGLASVCAKSEFLRAFRRVAGETTPGCILLERPDVLKNLVVDEGACDTSGRGKGLEEIAAMTPLPGHHVPGREIPEKDFFYRFAKKHWFFGFAAYG